MSAFATPWRRAPVPMRAGLALATAGAVIVVVHGMLGGDSEIVTRGINDLVLLVAATVCVARAYLVAEDRFAWSAIGLAIGLYALGDLTWDLVVPGDTVDGRASLADAFWLLFYVPLYAGVVLLLRTRIHNMRASVWLDGVIGALALTAVTTAMLLKAVLRAFHGDIVTIGVTIAYPIADVVLLLIILLSVLMIGRRPDTAWLVALAALLTMTLGDTAYLLTATGRVQIGQTLIDGAWPVGATLLAWCAWMPMPSRGDRMLQPRAEQLAATAFGLIALGVLTAGLFTAIPFVARVAALAAMTLTVARLFLSTYEAQLAEQSRHRQSRTDELTGLANRRGFYEQLEHGLQQLDHEHRPFAMLLMDLDHFKEFNDTLGHAAGDELLRQVTGRIEKAVPDDALVSRIGGDEFVILAPGLVDDGARGLAERIVSSLAQPHRFDDMLFHSGASIGVSLAPAHGRDRSTLLRRADIAMYRAKQQRTAVELFEDAHEQLSRDHVALAAALRRGVRLDELEIHYQPKCDLRRGEVRAVEALVRWRHPSYGLLMPDVFLPIGERYGLMREITGAVLDRALRDLCIWRRAGFDLAVGVNLCGADLLDSAFPGEVATQLARFDVDPSRLQFEVTETIVMVDPERILDTLARIRALGISLALDDYGTGHSSLAYLKRLPISELKIDRSFVREMTADAGDAVIVRSTIDLAHNLGIEVTAEGIEVAAHWDQLTALGCDIAQGYYLSRPLPASELVAWLGARSGGSAAA